MQRLSTIVPGPIANLQIPHNKGKLQNGSADNNTQFSLQYQLQLFEYLLSTFFVPLNIPILMLQITSLITGTFLLHYNCWSS
jgi:hypothetical protein